MGCIVPIWLQQWSVLTLGFCVGGLLGWACSLEQQESRAHFRYLWAVVSSLQMGDTISVTGVLRVGLPGALGNLFLLSWPQEHIARAGTCVHPLARCFCLPIGKTIRR